MTASTEQRLTLWPFILSDFLLVALAFSIASSSAEPTPGILAVAVLACSVGGIFGATPFVIEAIGRRQLHLAEARRASDLEERQAIFMMEKIRLLEAQIETLEDEQRHLKTTLGNTLQQQRDHSESNLPTSIDEFNASGSYGDEGERSRLMEKAMQNSSKPAAGGAVSRFIIRGGKKQA